MIEEENDMPRDDIVVKSLPAMRVAMIRHPAPGFGGENLGPIIGPGITELYARLREHAVDVTGQPFVFYEGEPDGGSFVACVAFPVGPEVSGLPDPIEVIDLPAVDHAATVVLAGPADDTHAKAYRELARWIEANGYEVEGPGRDVFLNTAPPNSDADVIMEAQLPLSGRP
jgi:effector-binding domain-containing protein